MHLRPNLGAFRARCLARSGFADITDVRRPAMEGIVELAARYELPFAQPEWLSDVIARYDLTPPAG